MVFNLKNKKAQVGFGVPGAVGTMKQITVDDIMRAKNDEELDKIQNILNQNGIQNPDLIEALEAQKGVMQTQKSTQGLTGVLPVKENAPVTVVPSDHSAKNNVFNLKKYAQQALSPMDPMGLNDSPELQGDSTENRMTDQTIIKFKDGASVRQWLDSQNDLQSALQYLVGFDDGSGSIDLVKELIEDYFTAKGDPMTEPRVLEKKAGEIFDVLPSALKEEPDIMGIPKHVGETQETIKKLAKEHIQSLPVTSFNLKKTAQHKTLDNAILWGPSTKPRIDPFLHQPISDWHIVERNKGFGLVVDDIWNIDYETIWRQNIMDKYSQPYRDKDGNWVGGYIQKRFEVDKNIPNSTNMQLKPGQRRKPILPEYGNTESRLQAARANGDIEGALDTTKPFNWKAAQAKSLNRVKEIENELESIESLKRNVKDRAMVYQADLKDEVGKAIGIPGEALDLPFQQWSQIRDAYNQGDIAKAKQLATMGKSPSIIQSQAKKKKLIENNQFKNAQLKELKELEFKPYKYPGDKDPVQIQTICKRCGSTLNQDAQVCQNCGNTQIFHGQSHPAKPSDKGKQPSPFGVNKDVFIPKNTPIIAAKKHHIKHDNAEKNEEIVKDVYVSDEFNMCTDPAERNIRKNKNYVDNKLEDVWKSCQDLEIDG